MKENVSQFNLLQRAFRPKTIRGKLAWSTLVSATLALALALVVFSVYEAYSIRQALLREAAVVMDLIAANAAGPLAFEDPLPARQSLGILRQQPSIEHATLYLADGTLLASYDGRTAGAPSPLDRPDTSPGTLVLTRTIALDGRTLGRLEVTLRPSGIGARVAAAIGLAVLIALVTLLLANAATIPIRRQITAPLQRLVTLARQVTETGDYDQRLPDPGPDELGSLMENINRMLARVQQSDAELRTYRDRLEELVADRTRELSEQTARAEAANRAKSQFLATMSHEIRTPMTGIMGMSEVLLDSPIGVHERHFAQNILTSSEALLTVLNDILDFSKAEAGKLTLEAIPFDLEELLANLMVLLGPRAGEKHLDLALDLPGVVPRSVVGDPGRIRQVLLNLLGNAVKFTEQGQVLLKVRFHGLGDGQGTFSFFVEDSGIGIQPEFLVTLFEPFTQADGSFSRQYGGTGLGLSISRQLVELMGGRLAVDSHPGEGSAFQVTVPLVVTAPPEPTVRNFLGSRALVITPFPLGGSLLERDLTEFGFGTDRVSSPQELTNCLLARLDESPYDLVLHLPGVEATEAPAELARRLAGHQATSRAQVLLAAYPGCPWAASGPDSPPGWHLLSRPVTPTQLRRAIEEALAHWPALPTRPTHATVQPAAAQHPPPTRVARPILLAEDNPVTQEVIREFLEKLGHEVQVVFDGSTAVELACRIDYSLILMDCHMPTMDGFEATRRIRSHQITQGRRTPILALTANAMASDRAQCLSAGMDDHLPKPLRLETLKEALGRWLPSETAP